MRALAIFEPWCYACRTQPWLLQDGTGTATHRGQLEGGLGSAGSSAGYFVLIKEGAAFTALPAEQFYTFRPKQKCMLFLSDSITCKKACARKPAGVLTCLGRGGNHRHA